MSLLQLGKISQVWCLLQTLLEILFPGFRDKV